MKKILFILLISCDSGWAASADHGTTSASFLSLGVGARAEALGEAYSAAADDATALYWNPAALTRMGAGGVALMHAPYLDSSFYDFAAFAKNGAASAFAIGGQVFSYGNIDKSGVNGEDLGNSRLSDSALSASYAHRLGLASLGVTGKFIRSALDETAQTAAMDLGFLTPLSASDRIHLAFTVLNLGRGLKFDDVTSPLPTVYRLGAAWSLSKNLLTTFDWSLPRHESGYEAVGLEINLPTGDTTRVSLRGGFNSATREGPGISMGAGFGFRTLAVDYAFVPFGSLGSTHRISVSWNWK